MEKADLQTKTFTISGMTCVNCQNRIEKKLKNQSGVENAAVNYETGMATVTFNSATITFNEITVAIESLGYQVTEGKNKKQIANIAGVVVLIIALYMLLRMVSTSGIATAFPTAREGMGYGMLLVIGLLTSVHCIGMCGGINLSQTLRKNLTTNDTDTHEQSENMKVQVRAVSAVRGLFLLFPAILYNGGRLISYTAVGVVVGAVGSVITLSGRFQGAVQLIAGVFMLIMGINMLGLFPSFRRFIPRLPQFFAKKVDEQKTDRGPLVVGILNGFIPCGPLQAMQLYALSTGSPIRGGISMFLFCLGTIPLMFALGAVSSFLSGAKGQVFSRRVMSVGAILVAALGLAMFANGWSLSGFSSPLKQSTALTTSAPAIQGDVQIVNSTLLPNRYPAITVQVGVPVRWTINAPPGSINGCNNRVVIREYGIQYTFKQGDNVIEFLPKKTGRFTYSCWMGMIRSTITVVGEGVAIQEPDIAPKPAGVSIPTDKIAIAQAHPEYNYNIVTIRLNDDGFDPAIVVMQRNEPVVWNIIVDSLDPGNSKLIIPIYYAILWTQQGDNLLPFRPTDDFEFSTGDNAFYGYVKVVDDIGNIDIEQIKAEVAEHETLMYPEAYFEAGL